MKTRISLDINEIDYLINLLRTATDTSREHYSTLSNLRYGKKGLEKKLKKA